MQRDDSPFLTAEWRDLVMISWAVDRSLLRERIPRGTELDLWEGNAVASIVAFDFRDIRLRGIRIPLHTRFPEVNLRFHVRRKLPDGSWRRGVAFVEEMVPRRAVAWVARRVYGEPYVARPMRSAAVPATPLADDGSGATRSLVYEWQRDGEWERIIALTTQAPRPMRRASIEAFTSSVFWGYTARATRSTLEYAVTHPEWLISMAADCIVEADLPSLYGPRLANIFTTTPLTTFIADGSAVTVSPGTPLERHR